jgi:hypothetical protein
LRSWKVMSPVRKMRRTDKTRQCACRLFSVHNRTIAGLARAKVRASRWIPYNLRRVRTCLHC